MPTYSLTQAELAVLTRHLLGEDLRLDQAAHADLGVDDAQLRAAEAELRQRAWLLPASDGGIAVADELAAVLAATIFPDQVAVLRTTLPHGEQPATNVSWSAELIVRNTPDEHGRHVFAVLDDAAAAVDEILAASKVPQDVAGPTNGATAALETLVAKMQALSMLMVVEQPAQPKPEVRNLSWLLAGGDLWLVDAEQAAGRHARRVDRSALRQAIAAVLRVS